jgi:hypothetical protein
MLDLHSKLALSSRFIALSTFLLVASERSHGVEPPPIGEPPDGFLTIDFAAMAPGYVGQRVKNGEWFIPEGVFVTETGPYDLTPNGGFVFSPKNLELARQRSECQPAGLDLQGNWGLPFHGYQVSLRFEKDVFRPNELVKATVHLRNVSTDWVLTFDPTAPVEYTIVTGMKTVLRRKVEPVFSDAWSHSHGELRPGVQRVFKDDLSVLFDLTRPGEYVVTASVAGGLRGGILGLNRIPSGNAIIRIEGKVDILGATNDASKSSANTLAGQPSNKGFGSSVNGVAGRTYPGLKGGGANQVHARTSGGHTGDGAASAGQQTSTAGGPLAVAGTASPWRSRDAKFGFFVLLLAGGTVFWLWSRHRAARPQRR